MNSSSARRHWTRRTGAKRTWCKPWWWDRWRWSWWWRRYRWLCSWSRSENDFEMEIDFKRRIKLRRHQKAGEQKENPERSEDESFLCWSSIGGDPQDGDVQHGDVQGGDAQLVVMVTLKGKRPLSPRTVDGEGKKPHGPPFCKTLTMMTRVMIVVMISFRWQCKETL